MATHNRRNGYKNPRTTRFGSILSFLIALLIWPQTGLSEVSASATFVTDYVFNGYSKTNGNTAIQIGAEYSHEFEFYDTGVFVGIWGSSVDFPDVKFQGIVVAKTTANIEFAPYLGASYILNDDWYAEATFVRYIYDGKIAGLDPDYNELYFATHYKDLISASIAYSQDYGLGDDGVAFELNGRYDFVHGIRASATGGYNNAQNALGQDYFYWNAGLTKNFGPLTLDLRYHDGDADNLFGNGISTVNGVVFKISATIGP